MGCYPGGVRYEHHTLANNHNITKITQINIKEANGGEEEER